MQNHSQEKCENQLFCLLQLSLPILTAFGDDVFGHIFLIQCYSVDTDPFFCQNLLRVAWLYLSYTAFFLRLTDPNTDMSAPLII